MTANSIAETYLREAGAIVRGETRKLPTLEHLQVLAQLVTQAQSIFTNMPVDWNDARAEAERDWLREAAKVSR